MGASPRQFGVMVDLSSRESAGGDEEFIRHFTELSKNGHEGAAYLRPERWASSGWFPFREPVPLDALATGDPLASLPTPADPGSLLGTVSPIRVSLIRVSSGGTSSSGSSESHPFVISARPHPYGDSL